MKANNVLLLASTAASVISVTPEASVYIFDQSSRSLGNEPPSTNPETARLLLANRLGLSQYHSLKEADSDTLKLLNEFGGRRESLFDDDENGDETRSVLIIVEGVEKLDSIFDADDKPAFTISNPPPPSSNLRLATDFLAQASHCRRPFGNVQESVKELDLLSMGEYELGGYSSENSVAVYYVSTLVSIGRQEGISGDRYSAALRGLRRLLSEMRRESDGQDTTVVLMPLNSKLAKRTSNSYGTYIVPAGHHMVRQQQEEPLSMATPPLSPSPSSQSLHPSHPQALRASTLPKTTLPICHSTESLCVSTTLNCSGHGSCYKKYTQNGTTEGASTDCWTCGCGSTVTRMDSDGLKKTKTTHWGGPACQKKDVSALFFLLAGFAIAMLATVSWGIGMLYSIGQEDLPSVIGAGVAGPRAQK